MTETSFDAAMTADLLRSVLFELPDAVFVNLRRTQQDRATTDGEWQRFDSGNPRAVLEQPRLAQRLLDLAQEETRLARAHATAVGQVDAFLKLAWHCKAAGERVKGLTTAMLAPPLDEAERARLLGDLLDAARFHDRLVWLLGRYSRHRLFRERPSPVKVLRAEWELRVKELERATSPGTRASKPVWPPEIATLMATLDGHTPHKEMETHA